MATATIDPTTGRPLHPDAIQRILHISPKVHVYNIPPLTSNKGHMAAAWTADNNKRQIFTARLRLLETATPNPRTGDESLRTDILLEDASNGQLFAAAPYTAPAVVEQVLDSSRFFAVRVQGDGGRKATIGIGFEERSDAFDFSVALQEVQRALSAAAPAPPAAAPPRGAPRRGVPLPPKVPPPPEAKDYSLKEGETITVNLGGRGRRGLRPEAATASAGAGFSLPPPPSSGGGGLFSLPPPPSAQEVKDQRRRSRNFAAEPGSIEEMGFDDGEFGEFQ